MVRLLKGLGALVVWAGTSAFLYILCLLSVSETIITAACVVMGICLLGSAIALASGRDGWLFGLAAGPGVVSIAILGFSFVVGTLFM